MPRNSLGKCRRQGWIAWRNDVACGKRRKRRATAHDICVRGARNPADISVVLMADVEAGTPPCVRVLVAQRPLRNEFGPCEPRTHATAPWNNSMCGPRATATTMTTSSVAPKHSATAQPLSRWREKQTSTGPTQPGHPPMPGANSPARDTKNPKTPLRTLVAELVSFSTESGPGASGFGTWRTRECLRACFSPLRQPIGVRRRLPGYRSHCSGAGGGARCAGLRPQRTRREDIASPAGGGRKLLGARPAVPMLATAGGGGARVGTPESRSTAATAARTRSGNSATMPTSPRRSAAETYSLMRPDGAARRNKSSACERNYAEVRASPSASRRGWPR